MEYIAGNISFVVFALELLPRYQNIKRKLTQGSDVHTGTIAKVSFPCEENK